MNQVIQANIGQLKSCYLGLGSNLQSPAQQIEKAYRLLKADGALKQCRCSPLYQSKAMVLNNDDHQPDYINAVMHSLTDMDPNTLLSFTQRIERQLGRPARSPRWSPRIIDIDLLWMENAFLRTPLLTLPHPGIMKRTFVLFPLAELDPQFILPNNIQITDHIARIKNEWNVRRLDDPPKAKEL